MLPKIKLKDKLCHFAYYLLLFILSIFCSYIVNEGKFYKIIHNLSI